MAEDSTLTSRSSTQIKVVKLRHTWTIHNFRFCCEETGKKLISPTFSARKNQWNHKSEWSLWLYPRGENKENNAFVACYLVPNTGCDTEIYTKYKLGIINADDSKVLQIFEESYRFTKNGTGHGFRNFIEYNVLFNQENKFVVDDKLTIYCEIDITLGSENTSETVPTPQSDLPKDFDFLLGNSELSDITLLAVGGKEFCAHKVILAARSPVFRAMFQHDMAESRKNRVEITDLDEEGLNEMLRYMYTGEIHELDQMAPRLLEMAEKYAMDGLKIKCEKALSESLSVENAAETFILSDTFRATELKNRVKIFVVAHAAEVGKTPGFESMVRTHPHLGVEAFCVLSNPSCKKKSC